MQPFAGVTGDAVSLAEVGKTYVIYLPHGGTTTLDLTGVTGSFTARWFDPRSGKSGDPFVVSGDGKRTLEAPDAKDWVVQLTR
jgi:hypothetical protein